MPNDRSRDNYQGILVPDAEFTAANLAADSSYTCPDPIPGQPVPSASYDLALSSAGYQTSGAITIQTQQGGNIGRGGATFIYNPGDILVDPFLGWDAPTVVTGWESLVWDTTPTLAEPFLLPLANGDLLAFYARGTGSNTVYVSRRSAGSWSTPAEIDLGAVGTAGVNPCAFQLPSGRIQVYALIEDAATDTATARMMYSDDNGDTWVVGASGVLPAAFDVSSGSSGFVPNRMRVAVANGQVLLILALRSRNTTPNYASEIRQYASSDMGHTFSLVWTSDRAASSSTQQGGAYPDVSVADDTFIVTWLSTVTNKPKIRTIASTYQSLGDATAYDPVSAEVWGTLDGTGKYFTDGDLVLVSDETGTLYLTGRQTTVSGRPWLIQKSTDLGASWEAMARSSGTSGGGKWWDGGDNDTYPKDAHGCWYQGRLVLLHSFAANPGTYDGGSLVLSALGGYSSATMPGYDAWRIDSRQVTWGRTWNPYDLPGDMGWTRSVSGSPTETLINARLNAAAGVGSTIQYSRVPVGTVSGGIIARWIYESVSGTTAVRLQMADAGEGYQLNINLSTTTLTVDDGIGATTIATETVSGKVDVLAAIGAGGVCSVWIRSNVSDVLSPTRTWTQIVSAVSLTDAAGAGITANAVGFGHPVSSGSSRWTFLGFITDESATYTGQGLGNASFPDDLLGRRYATTPVELQNRTAIAASGGPTWAGDTWTVTTDYERPPSHIHPEVSPSQREGARFDQATQQDLIWDTHTGSADNGLLGYPIACALLDTNIPTATLYGWDGAAWVSIIQLSTQLITGSNYTRKGRYVTCGSGGTAFYATRNQLAGGWVNLGSSKYRRILRNTEGLVGSTSSVRAILELADVDETEPTSGTQTVYAGQVVGYVPEPSAYQRYKLTIPAFTAPEGYMRLGKVVLGSLALFARSTSPGRETSFEPQQLTDRVPGGPRTVRRLGPPIRRVALPFSQLLPTSQIYASSPSPDYVRLYTSGEEIAAAHATGPSMTGLVQELEGRPIVYLGKIPKVSSNSTTCITHPQQIIYGRIYEGWRYVAEGRGHELANETWTTGGLVVEEEP